MTSICIIPARAGSQRIKGKNWKRFHGKPIIEYSIEVADRSGLFHDIIVSTDGSALADIAEKKGASKVYRRPSDLARNEIGTQEVARQVCEKYFRDDFRPTDLACVIYPTSPLLHDNDLWRGLALLRSNRQMRYAFSVGTSPLQDAGNFYWGYVSAFMDRVPVHDSHSIMVPISADRVCDINTPEDWDRAEKMYSNLLSKADK